MNNFEENVIKIWGSKGKKWLKDLPVLVRQCADFWQLQDLKPVFNLSYNYVLSGCQSAVPVILKLSFDKEAVQNEAAALKIYNGQGCAKLLAFRADYGALLVQRAMPGKSLKFLFPHEERKSIKIASQLMKQLHSVVLAHEECFPKIGDWLSVLEKKGRLLPHHHQEACAIGKKLLATSEQAVLLHGDLHHENILSHGLKEWLVIDPKGVIGEPAYEVGAFIRNPIPELSVHPDAGSLIQRRITLFAEFLQLSADRIREWSYVQAVVAAIWSLEDKSDPAPFLKTADFLGFMI